MICSVQLERGHKKSNSLYYHTVLEYEFQGLYFPYSFLERLNIATKSITKRLCRESLLTWDRGINATTNETF